MFLDLFQSTMLASSMNIFRKRLLSALIYASGKLSIDDVFVMFFTDLVKNSQLQQSDPVSQDPSTMKNRHGNP